MDIKKRIENIKNKVETLSYLKKDLEDLRDEHNKMLVVMVYIESDLHNELKLYHSCYSELEKEIEALEKKAEDDEIALTEIREIKEIMRELQIKPLQKTLYLPSKINEDVAYL